jgi:hypothetical protein
MKIEQEFGCKMLDFGVKSFYWNSQELCHDEAWLRMEELSKSWEMMMLTNQQHQQQHQAQPNNAMEQKQEYHNSS